MRRILACFVAAALLALSASACSSTLSDAATVRYQLSGSDHEDHVTRSDLVSEVGKIVKNKAFADFLEKQGFSLNGDVSAGSNITSIWLTQLIQQKATDALFASRHLTISPTIRDQVTQNIGTQVFPSPEIFSGFDSKFRAELIDREARRQAVLNSYFDSSDEAGRRYFEAHKDQFACPSGKDVSHILVDSPAKAEQIIGELRNGASFSQLAQQDSTDTGSAASGGALGCLAPGSFVESFQSAADAAPFDTPVGPVKSQFGYHVILVTHATNTYEAVRSQVRQALAQQAQTEAEAARNKLLASFKVHIDPRYGTWRAVNGAQGLTFLVQPPEAPAPNSQREGTTTTTQPGLGVPNGGG